MSIAKTLGNATGSSAAYAKHGVVSTGIGGRGFIADYIAETKAAYARKDAELAARREAMRQALIAAPVSAPKVTRQRRLAA